MAKSFDPTARQLIEMGPADWLECFGRPVPDPSRVRIIDSNLSTILPEADRVIRVDAPEPWIEHIELQAGRDPRLPDRAHLYSTALESHHRVPVRSTLILLREAADGPDLTGLLEKKHRDGTVYDSFQYNVVRVWEQPVERFLRAGLTVLPLAPVANIAPERLREILAAVAGRLRQEATTLEQRDTLWSATQILLSLRYEEEQAGPIFREVSAMSLGIRGIEESWLYQKYFQKGLAEGKAEGKAEEIAASLDRSRKHLLLVGRGMLGEPSEAAQAEIRNIEDLGRLDALLERALKVATWEELLAS